jgi:hypothetical protein
MNRREFSKAMFPTTIRKLREEAIETRRQAARIINGKSYSRENH